MSSKAISTHREKVVIGSQAWVTLENTGMPAGAKVLFRSQLVGYKYYALRSAGISINLGYTSQETHT